MRYSYIIFVCAAMILFLFATVEKASSESISPGETEPILKIYKIQPNDTLEISVWGVNEMTRSVSVRPDGRISYPLIGDIAAVGKTVDELTGEIEKKLQKYVNEADVSIIVTKYSVPTVYILGDIENTGPYELKTPKMMLQLLAQAKMVNPDIENHSVTIVRRGKNIDVSLDVEDSSRENAANFELQDGDVIYVSHRDVPSVYVIGNVPGPGPYAIPDDPTKIDLVLARAGAMNISVLSSGVVIIRDGMNMRVGVGEIEEDFELEPDDVVFVPAVKGQAITVTGAAAAPGVYPFVEGYTIMDVIHAAGGFADGAATGKVKIYRNYPEETEIIEAGELYSSEITPSEVQPGDVIYIPRKPTSVSEFITRKFIPLVRDVVIISDVISD